MKITKEHSFPPIWNEKSTILILGTLPSIQSSKAGFYYMHPQNRFWKILSKVFETDFVLCGIEEKKQQLLELKIALYDVVQKCEIQNSSDAKIQNVQCNDLEEIIQNASIERIFLNGQKAYELFCRFYPHYTNKAILLPSTSSANASYSLDNLFEKWKIIRS